jgi:hypothetical protein
LSKKAAVDALIVKVTGTFTITAPTLDLSATWPEYVPAASPAALTATGMEYGVDSVYPLPIGPARLSQLPPVVVDATAVKLKAVPVVETGSICGSGLTAPNGMVKFSDGRVSNVCARKDAGKNAVSAVTKSRRDRTLKAWPREVLDFQQDWPG